MTLIVIWHSLRVYALITNYTHWTFKQWTLEDSFFFLFAAVVPVSDDGAWQVSVTAPVPCWSQLCGAAACPGRAAGRERLDPAGSGAGSRVRGRLAHRYADMWRRPCFPEPEARGSPRGPCVCVLAYVPLCSPLLSDNAGTWKTVLGQVRPLWSSSLFILQWDTRWSMDGCFFCFVFLCKNCQKKHFFLFLSLNTEPISSSPYVLLWFWNGTFFHLLT